MSHQWRGFISLDLRWWLNQMSGRQQFFKLLIVLVRNLPGPQLFSTFTISFFTEVRKVTGIFKNVKPSSGNWKAGSFGLGAVQIAYMVAKDVTTASIWIHTRSKEANSRGLAVLKRKQSEIEKLVKGEEMLFREQETSSVDISINGIGWGAESPEARTKLLSVLGALTDVAKLYESELRKALEESSE